MGVALPLSLLWAESGMRSCSSLLEKSSCVGAPGALQVVRTGPPGSRASPGSRRKEGGEEEQEKGGEEEEEVETTCLAH